MAFNGYCTVGELARFLDIGLWQISVTIVDKYELGSTLYLPITGAAGISFNLIDKEYSIYINGVELQQTDYTVDLKTGKLTFVTEPSVDDKITADYYMVEDFSNEDLEYYVLLGAYELEKDTLQKFREVDITDFQVDANEGYDYINYTTNARYISLPYYPILEVTKLTVNNVPVTTSTLHIKGNKISLTDTSEVKSFSGKHNSIKITFKYGIYDDPTKRTDEDSIRLQLANAANKFISAAIISEHPLGRNVLIDNSKITQASRGDVRPTTFNENTTTVLKNKYNEYVAILRGMSAELI